MAVNTAMEDPMDKVYSTVQVADMLGVDTSQIRRMAARHEIGTKLNPRLWIFTEQDYSRLRALRAGVRTPRKAAAEEAAA